MNILTCKPPPRQCLILVNRHVIAANRKSGDRKPPLSVKTYKTNDYTDSVSILGTDGEEACRLVYSPDRPLSCGATIWIEVDNADRVIING